MIVHTLKMCTGDAGPEQSLVLFLLSIENSQCGLQGHYILFIMK